ncbi:Receptor-type guanylate cyclase gcy [Seminavis robusta]|uniref:Receptor-type guanylate cyclase gcy n=1 Tax=Seminavis robusta TaxID=568900 RepID=A0A9N8E4B0_9STRA|nr:Receptor-type guanylate cyclase gcy [Seminavis robusta]|eukprot:Sro650_g181420.1 Receptor-type guanylate cyclase gcy (1153) ;mRNA; r:35069-40168
MSIRLNKMGGGSQHRSSTGSSDKEFFSDTLSTGTFSAWGGGSNNGESADDMDEERANYEAPVVAAKEEKMVLYSKIAVVLVLLVAVAGMAAGVYQLVSSQEQQEFGDKFESWASEVIAISAEHVTTTFETIEQFAVTVASTARTTNSVWPNVTIDDYPLKASMLMKLTGLSSVTLLTLVSPEDKLGWEAYARERVRDLIQEDLEFYGHTNETWGADNLTIYDEMMVRQGRGTPLAPVGNNETIGNSLPHWQKSPVSPTRTDALALVSVLGNKSIRDGFETSNATGIASIAFFAGLGIRSQVVQPIWDQVTHGKLVGAIWSYGDWGAYFQNLVNVPATLFLVVESSCGFVSTYALNGLEAELLGLEDLHDPAYDDMVVTGELFTPVYDRNKTLPDGVCVHDLVLKIYPSSNLESTFVTYTPLLYAGAVVLIFAITSLIFIFYDQMVRRRQVMVMKRLIREDQIVSSLFPSQIRARMYQDNSGSNDDDARSLVSKRHVELFNEDLENPETFKSAPLADLFLNTTVMFADIAGFTAWSSAKDPILVFMLLETIYSAFDKLANRYGVFKVETVGDCYVAAAGVPDPRNDHPVIMAKFARACMMKMKTVTQKLEVTLGPDTGDLALRVGLHSGQCTAGVLRGDKARYQIFGDTVNTASRIETSSVPGKIHISDFTAELLKKAGKGKWLVPRAEKIPLAGKGDMQTFWLLVSRYQNRESIKKPAGEAMMAIDEASEADASLREMEEQEASGDSMTKMERLVEWNTDVLCQLLRQILACRTAAPVSAAKLEKTIGQGQTVLEEFQAIVTLPKYSREEMAKRKGLKEVDIAPVVVDQLRDYITKVAGMYRSNSFHNFEHASHVVASVRKLLTRIVASNSGGEGLGVDAGHSFGITADPLTQFAVVFSAVIHDADHPGIPNTQMIKEGNPLASMYKEKSVAEQNSVDLCWDLLMKPEYKDLRKAIYGNPEELQRFRQLAVNTVMATDIVDKELQALRKNRWNEAFSENALDDGSNRDLEVDRKATIVIEHLIQASDVSHTMQHWKIYLQWNERFFFELYRAYKEGRAGQDPSIAWYKGEIGFFDFYIIPLAKKLENCGVFGVSSHEYLNYAQANRDEWVRKGEDVVAGYLKKYAESTKEEMGLAHVFADEVANMDASGLSV